MGLFDKFKLGLGKSSSSLKEGFKDIFSKKIIDDSVLDEFEELIISSDAGADVAREIRKDFENFKIDKKLEERVKYSQTISSLTLSLRAKEKIKVRQPLSKILIPVNSSNQKEIINDLSDSIDEIGLMKSYVEAMTKLEKAQQEAGHDVQIGVFAPIGGGPEGNTLMVRGFAKDGKSMGAMFDKGYAGASWSQAFVAMQSLVDSFERDSIEECEILYTAE
mgnify:CR=1 FL=1